MDFFTLVYKGFLVFLIVYLSIGLTIIARLRLKELNQMEKESKSKIQRQKQ